MVLALFGRTKRASSPGTRCTTEFYSSGTAAIMTPRLKREPVWEVSYTEPYGNGIDTVRVYTVTHKRTFRSYQFEVRTLSMMEF